MGTYREMLDDLVTEITDTLGIPTTRDPAVVGAMAAQGGCVFVKFPRHIGRLLVGPNLEVPVSLVAPAPADITSVNWLLDNYDAFVALLGSQSVTEGAVDIGTETYPAVTVIAQIALDTTEV
jgi:hypothetical protein